MLTFSDCKINLGLNITERRADGYHEVVTCMMHVPWHDIIEILPANGPDTTLTVIGNNVDCPPEKNLVMRAYRAMAETYDLPPVDIVLQKIIPDGAGLGGGSADAAYTLRLLNDMFHLNATTGQLSAIAARIGADCAFFVHDRTMICTGIGEILEPFDLDLSQYTFVVVKPSGVSISTRQAYAGITPRQPEYDLHQALRLPVAEWQGKVVNDFEQSIFPLAPQIESLKRDMLEAGALYASMSGSGASVYGIFDNDKLAESMAGRVQSIPHLTFRPTQVQRN